MAVTLLHLTGKRPQFVINDEYTSETLHVQRCTPRLNIGATFVYIIYK